MYAGVGFEQSERKLFSLMRQQISLYVNMKPKCTFYPLNWLLPLQRDRMMPVIPYSSEKSSATSNALLLLTSPLGGEMDYHNNHYHHHSHHSHEL